MSSISGTASGGAIPAQPRAPQFIRLAAWADNVTNLGPGQRFALWVQGCPFSCPGCLAPSFIPRNGGFEIPVSALTDAILQFPSLEGVTLSGGEPFLQATALAELVRELRKCSDFSTICYTGFTLENLSEGSAKNPGVDGLLSLCDVLIDGPYRHDLNDSRGLRGSSNQRVHFLTERYQHLGTEFEEAERVINTRMFFTGERLMIGIPALDQWNEVNLSEDPQVWYSTQ